jgi:hypothetical protein
MLHTPKKKKPALALTAKRLERLKTPGRYRDGGLPGLYLQVTSPSQDAESEEWFDALEAIDEGGDPEPLIGCLLSVSAIPHAVRPYLIAFLRDHLGAKGGRPYQPIYELSDKELNLRAAVEEYRGLAQSMSDERAAAKQVAKQRNIPLADLRRAGVNPEGKVTLPWLKAKQRRRRARGEEVHAPGRHDTMSDWLDELPEEPPPHKRTKSTSASNEKKKK